MITSYIARSRNTARRVVAEDVETVVFSDYYAVEFDHVLTIVAHTIEVRSRADGYLISDEFRWNIQIGSDALNGKQG